MTIEFYHLLFSGVIEMIRFFSFNHTMWCITLIDFLLLKGFCIPGKTNFYSEFLFLAPCLRSCFGGSMSFPVLGPYQKLQFQFSWNVLLDGSGNLDLLISDVVGVAKRLQGTAQCFRLCICHRGARWKSGADALPKQPSKVTYFGH